MGVAKTSRPGTGSPLLQHLLAIECGEGLAPSPECPGPCNSPGAPRLQASTVPGYDGGAMLVSPLPSPTPCPSKLEAGAALLQPGVQPGVQPQASKQHPLVRRQPLPRPSTPRRTNEYAPRNISFLGATGDRRDGSRLTAPPHPHITTQYCCSSPRLQQSTVQRRGAEAKAGGERATSFFGSPPAPPEPSSSASCCWRNDSILSRLDSTSFPSVPVPIEFPPSLRPSSHRPTRISRLVAKIPGWSLPRFTTAPLLPLARLISSLSGAWLAGMVAGAGRVRQKRWGWPAACGR